MDVSLTVETGRPTGSRSANRLRAEGLVPGVVYGRGSDPVSVTVPWPELRKALSTEAGLNALIDLTIDGDTQLSIVKDLQRDPVRRTVEHVDFILIDRNATLSVDVPVVLAGEAKEVENEKGIVDQILYSLTVEALPGKIPNQLEVDISHLTIGSTVTVGELSLPDGVSTLVDPEEPIAVGSETRSAVIAAQEVEGEEGEEGEGAEGEGEGDESEGGEAAEGDGD